MANPSYCAERKEHTPTFLCSIRFPHRIPHTVLFIKRTIEFSLSLPLTNTSIYCDEAEKVVIGDEVTSVGCGAFLWFSSITEVKLGVSVVVFWVKLRRRGYSRTIAGLYKALCRIDGKTIHLPNPKKKTKEYEKMQYPGQRVQIDVKYVPDSCLVGEARIDGGFFQYTFIDEYSRFRIIKAYKEHSTYSSSDFVRYVVNRFPYAIECIQTDNGCEFTNRLNRVCSTKPTLFETTLKELGIQHKLIKHYTPRHNGKVERSHRKDNEYFYAMHKFYSFADFENQLAVWIRKYNNFPMRPLNWRSPKDVLFSFPNCKV